MALMEMNDHVDGVEALRAFNAGGVPTQYPLGINGMGAENPASITSNPYKKVFNPYSYNTGINPPSAQDCAKWLDDNSISTAEYKSRGCTYDETGVNNFWSGYTPPSTTPKPTGPQGKAQEWVDALKQLLPLAAPLVQKRPKVKNVIQKEPDYTTYAVIGGAVIVASVLAIAIGKSGARRQRD